MLYTLYPERKNAPDLDEALNSLKSIIEYRMQQQADNQYKGFQTVLQDFFKNSSFAMHISRQTGEEINAEEFTIIMMALAPHILPHFFESAIASYLPNGGDFPEFGGVRGSNHRGMLPTGETVQFVLAGRQLEKRLELQQYFTEGHFFYSSNMLWLEPVKEGEPFMSGRMVLASDFVEKILYGKETAPRFGLDFPARRITTQMSWEDVVLNEQTAEQIKDINTWMQHHDVLKEDANLKNKIKPGYRVLFHGPSGTGKTLTAALIGKQFQKDVYRIDLSQIVSKYIGETEKNLENVFRRAESKNWILFFDEADALFGKRTNVQSSHDKYANQEVSYLLQRVEDYPGLLILASNFKSNLDDAFLRRFHAIIHFPLPNMNERLQLWQKAMPASLTADAGISLRELARQYEMTGASILNAVHYATLQCYARSSAVIFQNDLVEGIRKEFIKEEKSM